MAPRGATHPAIGDHGRSMESPAGQRPRVAFVDDDRDLLSGLRRTLRRLDLGWELAFHHDPREALAALVADPVDVVVADIRMPGLSGVGLASALAERCPATVIVVLSGSTDFDLAVSSINVGSIFRYLVKPCAASDLVATIAEALAGRGGPDGAAPGGVSVKAEIDLMATGVIVLGRNGEVLFTNQRAGVVLARRDGILVENTGTCRAWFPEDTRRLHEAIRTARESGQPVVLSIGSRDHGRLRLVARRREHPAAGVGMMICLHVLAQDDRPDVAPDLLRDLFGLDPAQSRVVAALANGLGMERAAVSADLPLDVARTCLESACVMLGVADETELLGTILFATGRQSSW
jgi:DNA-binding response OmpR family regulator